MIASVDIFFACIVLAAFAFGLRVGIGTLIVVRPLTDRLFELAGLEVAGHHVTYGILMNIVVLCAAIINIGKIRRYTPPGLRTIWLPFLLVCAIAVLYSPLPFDATRRVFIYVCYFAIFGLAFVVINSERDVLFFLRLVVLSSVLPVFFGLFQIFTGIDQFADTRIQSTFSHPNMFAFYLMAVSGVILFLIASERIQVTDRLRLLLKLYLIPLVIVLIMTKTRSAWIGCFVLFVAYGLVNDRRALVAILILAPIAFVIPAVNQRFTDLMSQNDYIGGPAVVLNSYAWRKLLWENALVYIWQQPVFGYGLHSFPFYSAEFFSAMPSGTYAHNDYLQLVFETGFVGLIAFLWIFCRCFIWLVRRWRFDKGGVSTAAAIMTAYLICSYSDNLLEYLPYQWEFWFSFAVICWHIARQSAGGLPSKGRFTNLSTLGVMRGLPAGGTASPAAGSKM